MTEQRTGEVAECDAVVVTRRSRLSRGAPAMGTGAAALLVSSFAWAEPPYHHIRLNQVETTSWTHVCVVAPVVYARRMADGDWHITLDDGTTKVVAEIKEAIPLPSPRKGQRVEVCGVTRWDKRHKWPEIHPVLRWTDKTTSPKGVVR